MTANRQPAQQRRNGRAAALLIAVVLPALALGLVLWPALPAAADCGGGTLVANESELNAAIADFNGQGGPCSFTIRFTDYIYLTAATTPIQNGNANVDLTIEGDGYTLSGNFVEDARPLTVYTGTVATVNDLWISDSRQSQASDIPGYEGDVVGGLILARSADLTLNRVQLYGGNVYSYIIGADAYGGAIFAVDSTVEINSADMLFNRVDSNNGLAGGGAIALDGGSLTLRNSRVGENDAGGSPFGFGAGISLLGGDGEVIIVNSTLDNNQARGSTAGNGAAVEVGEAGSLTIINSTIAENEGETAVAYAGDASLTIHNSIITDNSDDDCFDDNAAALDIQHSYIEDAGAAACGLPTANPDADGNIVGQGSAGLAPITDNGGPTWTYALPPGNAAVDAGDSALALDPVDPLTRDQRGAPYVRDSGADVDMGAYEAQCAAFPRTVNDEDELTDAIACYNVTASGGPHTIELAADIDLTKDLVTIDPFDTASLIIQGGDHTLDGGGLYDMFEVRNTQVEFKNITITGSDDDGIDGSNSDIGILFSTVTNNFDSGIVFQDGNLDIYTTTVSYNGFIGLEAYQSDVWVEGSTVHHNETGVFADESLLNLVNSTVAHNSDDGVRVYDSYLGVLHATIADNDYGIITDESELFMVNGVLARSAQADCLSISPVTQIIGYTLMEHIDDAACGLSAANPDVDGNIIGEPARLSPLGAFGGSTLTYRLLDLSGDATVTSPAINAGLDFSGQYLLTFDQRGTGFPRLVGPAPDMGSTEGALEILCVLPVTVVNETQLNRAILCYNNATTPGIYEFDLGANINLSAASYEISNATPGVSLSIDGNGRTVDGQDNPGARAFSVGISTTVRISDTTLTGGYMVLGGATNDAGGVANEGDLTLFRVTIRENHVNNDGGGIGTEYGSTTRIINSAIVDNTAGILGGQEDDGPGDGGGIDNEGVMWITNTLVSGNAAVGTNGVHGGGIYNEGALTVYNSTIEGNSASGTEDEITGGGISSESTLTLTHSTVSDNTVTGDGDAYGGGVAYVANEDEAEEHGSTLVIVNSTVSGNSVTDESGEVLGGGVYISDDFNFEVVALILNSTISDNAVSGGGADIYGGGLVVEERNEDVSLSIANSILANSMTDGSPGEDCRLFGPVSLASSHSLYEDTGSGACNVNDGDDGNITGVDPLLGPLANNGGPTETHALLAGSDAIDEGSNADANSWPLLTDQRGFFDRIENGTVDMGAYEVGAEPPVEPALFVSTQTPGTTLLNGNVSFGGEDVVKWDGSQWTMFFDGSQHNLLSKLNYHNIYALYVPDPNDPTGMLISFLQNKRPVPGIDEPVNGQDLVRFNGTDFDLHFDGSDVGLTKLTPEKIDGLAVINGPVGSHPGSCVETFLVSTQGPGEVPMQGGGLLRFRGEDVLEFCATSLGDATAGTWDLIFDGSTYWNRPNWLFSLSAEPDGSMLYFTTKGTAKFPNNAVGGHSVVFGFDTQTETFSRLFEVRPHGIRQKVDALSVVGGIP